MRAAGQLMVRDGLTDALRAHDRRDAVWRMVLVHIRQAEDVAQADPLM